MSAIGLPVNILAHFVPRQPLAYQRPRREGAKFRLSGMAEFLTLFSDEPSRYSEDVPEPTTEMRKRLLEERRAQHEAFTAEAREKFKPAETHKFDSDPYKTLFVARIAYETTERTLRRIFEEWGPIKSVSLISDSDGRSRGYAFIEYEHERDLKDAYKHADGIKVDGRSVVVDVERGRTVPGWYPRRLGGGKGPGRIPRTRIGKKRKQNSKSIRQSKFDSRRRSPARGGHSKYQRRGHDSSRRSSFNY
jgi:U1 small nuclear ribonucleoprotein